MSGLPEHTERAERKREAAKDSCLWGSCDRAARAKGLCAGHYMVQWQRSNPERAGATRQRFRERALRDMANDPSDSRHGTEYGYVLGCHCDRCTEAHRVKALDYRARTRAAKPAKTHCKNGHPLTPENRESAGATGTRCKPCRRTRRRERMQQLRGAADSVG